MSTKGGWGNKFPSSGGVVADRGGKFPSPGGAPGGQGGEILFIDARNLGHLINRRTRELSQEDINKIASTYNSWRERPPRQYKAGTSSGEKKPPRPHKADALPKEEKPPRQPKADTPPKEGNYEDIPGFCASAAVSKVAELDYVLTPGRYVGLPDEEDDFDFNERFSALKKELEEQLKEEGRLNEEIINNLSKVTINE